MSFVLERSQERVKKGTVLEGTVLQDAKGHDWLECAEARI